MKYVAWLTIVDADKNQRSRPQHLQYLNQLFLEGKVLMAGPFEDGTGGMVVYQNVDAESAWQLASGDPAVTSGARTVVVTPWVPLNFPMV